VTTTGVLLLASTCLYAGFQWTIRVLVYPQFAAVGPAEFAAYERLHQRRVSFAVGPLFAFFGVSALAALVVCPGVASGVAAGCFAAILAVTAFAAVPLHRRLTGGFDQAAHRRLVIVDSVRLGLAVAACVGAVGYA
jgi:hypothetical protein